MFVLLKGCSPLDWTAILEASGSSQPWNESGRNGVSQSHTRIFIVSKGMRDRNMVSSRQANLETCTFGVFLFISLDCKVGGGMAKA
jgi:hypothetical protein